MPETFSQLGIPFPLFEAPPSEASEYAGKDTCSLCGARNSHCFRLGVGCAVILPCPSCGAENGLDADDREDAACRKCGATVKFPELPDEVLTCYACLRAGKAAITKDTELGMISSEQAFEGVTHGVPGLKRDDFEMVPGDSDWVGARLPSEVMFELLRTPTYVTIQGEQWQFCCKSPMVFLGTWSRDDFDEHAPDGDGEAYFNEVVQGVVPGLWEDDLHDETGVYVFRCSKCARVTAHWDIA